MTDHQHSEDHHHSHHRHHHHHRSHSHLSSRQKKRRAIIIASVVGVALLLFGLFAWKDISGRASRHVEAVSGYVFDDGYRTIEYNGKKYQYNNLITNVLYAGIDSLDKIEVHERYAIAPRADSISLVVMDKKHHKMSILAINRDTMTQVRRFTANGYDTGTYETHIGYAFTYGDGGEISCANLKEAVSTLLQNVPIDEYVVSNQASIQYINDLLGGITVTVPNNDLAEKYPEFVKGATVTLDETNVKAFVQNRDTGVTFSNEGRMERQKTYVSAYIRKLKDSLPGQMDEIWKKTEQMGDYMMTSVTRNKYIGLANLVDQLDFNEAGFYVLQGADVEGKAHDEFYVDESALLDTIIELFYEEV